MSEGTTSRNSRPEAATASQVTRTTATIATRVSVTGLTSGGARRGQSAGLSHRSSLSVRRKNTTLTRITKQIAA